MGAGKLPHRDGMHTFDYVFIDFFYIDKMLNVGGVAVFDDTHFPSTRKVCRFILRNLGHSIEFFLKAGYEAMGVEG